MFKNLTAAIGAILISTACVAAAVGPAAANQYGSTQTVAAVTASAQANA